MFISFVNSTTKAEIDLATCSTISDILTQCAAQINVSAENINLVFKGRQLKPSDSISEKGITESSKIIGVIRKVIPSPSSSSTTDVKAPSSSDKAPSRPIESGTSTVEPKREPEHVSEITETTSMSDDEAYAKQELASAKYLPFLQECSHLPIKVNNFLAFLNETNPRLHNYISNHRGILIDAIVNVDPNAPVAPPQGRSNIQLSQEDVENIKKLMELGFSQEESVVAYLSCDRNVDMAAGFLFENMFNVF